MTNSQSAYWKKRAEQEEAMAAAADREAACVHRELARAYRQKISTSAVADQLLAITRSAA